jgi:hypothetical protein
MTSLTETVIVACALRDLTLLWRIWLHLRQHLMLSNVVSILLISVNFKKPSFDQENSDLPSAGALIDA